MATQPQSNPWDSEATIALFMAVLYHGLSSLAVEAIPARSDTVITTAQKFERHLVAHITRK